MFIIEVETIGHAFTYYKFEDAESLETFYSEHIGKWTKYKYTITIYKRF